MLYMQYTTLWVYVQNLTLFLYIHIRMILYNRVVYLPMEMYHLYIDFVFQFILEKYKIS